MRKLTQPNKDKTYEDLMKSHKFDYDINARSPIKNLFLPAPYKINYDGKWVCDKWCGYVNYLTDEKCLSHVRLRSGQAVGTCQFKRPSIITKWMEAGDGEEYNKMYWGEAFKARYPPEGFDCNTLLWKCDECKRVQAYRIPDKVKDLKCETKECGGLPKGQKIRMAMNQKLKDEMEEERKEK